MKNILFTLLFFVIIICCNEKKSNKVVTYTEVDCKILNDSAVKLLFNQEYNKSIELIDLAIKCDSNNFVFICNKGIILAGAGLYQYCINHLEKNRDKFSKIQYLSINAECYFYLKDTVKFDSLVKKVLAISEQEFKSKKSEENLIIYLTLVKKYHGEMKVNEILKENENIFTTLEKRKSTLELLNNVPTLKYKTGTSP